MLIACCAMGLLERRGGDEYRNTGIADQYLVRGRPLYQGDIIAFSATAWDIWDKLEDAVRRGRPPRQPSLVPDAAPLQRRNFSLAMHNMTMAGRGGLFKKMHGVWRHARAHGFFGHEPGIALDRHQRVESGRGRAASGLPVQHLGGVA